MQPFVSHGRLNCGCRPDRESLVSGCLVALFHYRPPPCQMWKHRLLWPCCNVFWQRPYWNPPLESQVTHNEVFYCLISLCKVYQYYVLNLYIYYKCLRYLKMLHIHAEGQPFKWHVLDIKHTQISTSGYFWHYTCPYVSVLFWRKFTNTIDKVRLYLLKCRWCKSGEMEISKHGLHYLLLCGVPLSWLLNQLLITGTQSTSEVPVSCFFFLF